MEKQRQLIGAQVMIVLCRRQALAYCQRRVWNNSMMILIVWIGLCVSGEKNSIFKGGIIYA